MEHSHDVTIGTKGNSTMTRFDVCDHFDRVAALHAPDLDPYLMIKDTD